ncbi:MAG: MarR family transcriptional regulator, partial [Chloroflexi bacterium]|nr:MarR family transcriptional regulator [Chloroflexota bacterium]
PLEARVVRTEVMQSAPHDQRFRKYVPFIDASYNFFALMHLAQSATFRARHLELKEIGLTNAEFQLLLVVNGLHESPTPADIARWMMRKPPTTTGLLHRMERNGLVRRLPDPNNRKLKRVVTTAKGEEALALATRQDISRTVLAALSVEEFSQLWSLLEKVKDTAEGLITQMERERMLNQHA